MKKQMSVFSMLVLAVVVLAGCPSVNLQNVDAANDAAEAVSADTAAAATSIPSSTENNPFLGTDNPYASGIDIPDGMGEVVIPGGSFNSAKAIAKAVNLNDVRDEFKDRATQIDIEFSLATSTEPVGKGGGNSIYVSLPVVNGDWEGKKCLLRAGSYAATVRVFNANSEFNYDLLFQASTYVTVEALKASEMNVLLYLYESHYFTFVIDSLPGSYNWVGSALITTVDVRSYNVYYRPYWETGEVVFCVWLPIDFDGADCGAELYVTDATGKPRAMDINFNIFDTTDQGLFYIPYVESKDVGLVNLNIGFVDYNE